MFAKFVANFLGSSYTIEDLIEKHEEGFRYLHSESLNSYFIPKKTLTQLAAAPPSNLNAVLTRRLASLYEWEDQAPTDLWVEPCPVSGGMMHRVAYPMISSLSFLRSEGHGIWITEDELALIRLHDPSIPGVCSDKPAGAAVEQTASSGSDNEDEEGNEVESGVGGMPAEKGEEGSVGKVWIIPGCIVCDLCENHAPSVFNVTEVTSTIRMESQTNWTGLSADIVRAAVDCPVEVIKYEIAAE